MNEKLSIHIYPRKTKSNKNGQLPLIIRITIAGQRSEFSTGKYIELKEWDSQLMKMKGNSERACTINAYLESLKGKIIRTETILNFNDGELTMANFKQAYSGKLTKTRMLVPIYEQHNKRIKQLINKEYALGTFKRHEVTLKHLREFMLQQYGVDDIDINKIDHAFISDFDFYLRCNRNCGNNSTVKYIMNFKKVIRQCIANAWLTQDPFVRYTSRLQVVERDVLNEEELQAIYLKDFRLDRLDVVRDIFIFSCYTGLAYIDVKRLTRDNLVKGIDGQLWISTHRQKTDSPSKIPLLDIPLRIIDKYAHHPQCDNEGTLLPVASNQKVNAYLKEIADIAGVEKALTFHIARHTFATTVTLSNGVPIESVSKMLGHKSIRTTQHYAKITDRKVANDMEALKELIQDKTAIPNVHIAGRH